jgi:hypothetical protein
MILLFGVVLFASCSRIEKAEEEKIKRRNCKTEVIYRSHEDRFYPIAPPSHVARAPYPWEIEGKIPKITREYFRCKGNPTNPHLPGVKEGAPIVDCEGRSRHGLPIFAGEEGVYPVLIDLLNFIQKKTMKRVIVTCGHRCPAHNIYADPTPENRTSKHQIGAEVDFYVQGMEDRPIEIVGLIMQYYQENPNYKNMNDYLLFQRYDKKDTNTSVAPWFNKEIFVKLFQKNEGRDLDNRHPHAYISLQVRFDKDKKERVIYDWARANKGYPHS